MLETSLYFFSNNKVGILFYTAAVHRCDSKSCVQDSLLIQINKKWFSYSKMNKEYIQQNETEISTTTTSRLASPLQRLSDLATGESECIGPSDLFFGLLFTQQKINGVLLYF